jgi:Na+-transporting NADH:ubiquinone oxidoreductase subunit B
MNPLQKFFDSIEHHFEKGGKYEKYYTIYEGFRTIHFSPKIVAPEKGVQIRDASDLKRTMITVVLAMIPCLLFGIWNIGHQHFLAIGQDAQLIDKVLFGAIQVVPLLVVSYGVGLLTEFIICVIRNHPVNEGYLVTGMLIVLVLPPHIPLWQVALATVFAVVIGKEVFGGTGMNILNVALTARAFLYFAYPSDISGEVWTYIPEGLATVDGYSGATALAIAYEASVNGGMSVVDAFANSWHAGMFSFQSLFVGTVPGSVGETSTFLALIGALILIGTRVASWKIIFSVFAGAYIMGVGFNAVGLNEYMLMPAYYHLVIGGLAFGAVFMATDPVSAAQTETGKWIYGFLIGALTVIIRVVNPAYPEGIMLAILLMNVFAPLIDHYVVQANKTRRLKRATV